MANERAVPESFPRARDTACVPGAQPKLVVREVQGQYTEGFTEEELQARFAMCEDLLIQLLPYCRRKASEHPEWTSQQLLTKVAQSLRAKGWDLTEPEVNWLTGQLDGGLRQSAR